ncbi:MATE family efflux transporter [Thalassotalea atypica]|uniref:MATE family efflux transporter n=1 Tax=Thalassotalea atypica TaxID=2054316 RepID=UPI00257269BC|nr:MATE family efflux transporter [Thalassotalea atypica]
MLGAILALLCYDLFESSLLALSGVNTLAALGFTIPLTTAMTAIAIGLSIRTNNKVVKSGCLERSNVNNVITTSLLMSVLIVGFLALFAYASNAQLLALMGSESWAQTNLSNEKLALVSQQNQYMAARYFGWIFLALIWQVNAILRALGHGVLASNLMLSWLTIKSILASLLLLPSSEFSIVAIKALSYVHVTSDLLFALLSVAILAKKLKLVFPRVNVMKSQLKTPKKDVIVVLLQQLITPVSISLLTIIAASIDYAYVAAFAFILRMESLFLLIPMVLTTSIPAIIGSNYWVGNKQRVVQAYLITFSFIILIQFIIAALLYFYIPSLSHFVCKQDTVVTYISRYFIWVSWGYLSVGCIMVYQSCLNAKGKTMQALVLGVLHRIVLLLLFAYVGSQLALQEDFYQGIEYGHVINAAVSINDNFYQGILIGHIVSGLLVLLFLYKNRTLTNSAAHQRNTTTPMNVLNENH